MNRKEREEKIELYGRGHALLTEALAGVPLQAWNHRPAPDSWSVHEIIVHIGDSESMAALRLRKLIVEPGSTLMGYEEAKWADALDYRSQDPRDSLEIIRLARLTSYRLLKSLPEPVFSHAVTHPEYSEPYTFEQWLNIYSRHIPDHIGQIREVHRAWLEQGGR